MSRAVLQAVTELRSQALALHEPRAARRSRDRARAGACQRVFALKEAYPDLKASENFVQLQRDLVKVEEHLQYARRFYNGAVRDYNDAVQRVPDVVCRARLSVLVGRVLSGARRGAPGGAGGGCIDEAHHLRSLLALFVRCGGARAKSASSATTSTCAIQADGALDVTERITVRAEGSQIRRGIYRDFPTRYRDRYGNRVVVDLKVLGVQRNGEAEPWFTETADNGVRINTGNDDFLPVPAEHTFTLRYRTTRQLGFFADHDELYWNAIGTGWAFPIDAGTCRRAVAGCRSPSIR